MNQNEHRSLNQKLGHHPLGMLLGEPGKRCGQCLHLVEKWVRRKWEGGAYTFECGKLSAMMDRTPPIRLKWPACYLFEQGGNAAPGRKDG